MPKKKHKPRRTASQRRRHQGAPRRDAHRAVPADTGALLQELEDWARGLDLFLEDSTWLVDTAIDLKSDFLDSPDPTAWTEAEIRTVLTELFPRKVVTDAGDRRLLAPAMTLFFTFLLATGRWRSPLGEAEVTALMEQLAADVPQAFEDASRRTMGGNIIEHALQDGVDVRDPAALADFVARDNSLPYDERVAISDGVAPNTDGPEGALNPFASIWPVTLGPTPRLDVLAAGPFEAAEVAASFERSPILRRARALVGWVGAGRPVTSTGALRRADTLELMRLTGIERDEEPRSMWEVPELAVVWVAVARAGYVEIGKTRVTPGGRALPPVDGPAEAVAGAGAGLHAAVLHALLDDRGGEGSIAHEPDLLLGALLRAAEPEGFTCPEPPVTGDDWDPAAMPALLLHADLVQLARMGIVERQADTFRLPELLHPVVPAALSMLTTD
ncbi:hypothetical protein [Georgenia sp. AZ-5]|uniref:hypothetical protein n=1 Tax=Georgenia sp. AZ-5 TaxID=3367526 RepID=UPI003754C6BE